MSRLVKGVIFVAIIIAIGYIFLPYFILNENRLQGIAGEILGDDYIISMSSVSWNPVQRSISSEEIKIVNMDDEVLLEIEELSLVKIDIVAAIKGNLSADNLEISGFFVDMDQWTERESEQVGQGNEDIMIHISHISVGDGTVIFSDANGGKGEFTGVNVSGALAWDATCENCDFYNSVKDLRVNIEGINYLTGNGIYHINANQLIIDESQSVIEFATVRLDRLLNDKQLRESLEYRKDYFESVLSGISMSQIHFDDFRDKRDVIIEDIVVEKAELHVTSDHNLPEEPESDPSKMPHTALEQLPFRLVIEKLQLESADLRYTEYDSGVKQPGSILFAQTTAETSRIDNRSAEPITVNARSKVMEQGFLEVTFFMQMGRVDLDLNVRGTASEFDLTLLNEIFVDLEGILIEDGWLEHLEFDFDMNSNRAEGILDIVYSNLSIDVVNRNDREQNLVNVLEGIFVDRVVVRSASNSVRGESREGEIAEPRDPDSGFFNYLWSSFRSGLFDAVKRF